MERFDKIINDQQIINLYNQISDYEDVNNSRAHHNFNHVRNVADLVEKILTTLNYESDFIEEAKIASILHDTGCLNGKDGHADRGYEYAKKYIKDNNIILKYEDMVLSAIKNHSNGFETDNIITLALILADKLDIKYTRVAKEGYNIPGMKEMQYINDILVNINNNVLKIEFICDERINLPDLENYYFMPKVFKSIKAFADKMNLKSEVLINGSDWKAFSMIND